MASATTTTTAISRLTVLFPANAGVSYPLRNSNFPSSSRQNGRYPPRITTTFRANRRLRVVSQAAGAPSKDVSSIGVGQDRLLKVLLYYHNCFLSFASLWIYCVNIASGLLFAWWDLLINA